MAKDARPAKERLAEIIDRSGKSDAEAAKGIGISPAALSCILSGTDDPGHLTRILIDRFTRGAVAASDWMTAKERAAIEAVEPVPRSLRPLPDNFVSRRNRRRGSGKAA